LGDPTRRPLKQQPVALRLEHSEIGLDETRVHGADPKQPRLRRRKPLPLAADDGTPLRLGLGTVPQVATGVANVVVDLGDSAEGARRLHRRKEQLDEILAPSLVLYRSTVE
jgi:hypothetical protein